MKILQAELIAGIFQSFIEERTWKQAELARRLSVTTERLRETLAHLVDAGWHLHRDEDPPHVYWSVPKGWVPGGVVIASADVPAVIRSLLFAPASAERDRLLSVITRASSLGSLVSGYISPLGREGEIKFLVVAEEAVATRTSLHFQYYTSSPGGPFVRAGPPRSGEMAQQAGADLV